MRILCTGISHKTAPVVVRERLAFSAPAITGALNDLKTHWDACEFVILSTCNRTEIYAARPLHGNPREHELHAWIGEYLGVEPQLYADHLFTLSGPQAARHLFEVASGLDSLVPGEAQIVSQVKNAYAAAKDRQCCTSVLCELFDKALHVAKHVRTETPIRRQKASVASVAARRLGEELAQLEDKTILVVGAGKINSLVLKHLAAGPSRILIANRSERRAKSLNIPNATVVQWNHLANALAHAHAVITSTAADEPIITHAMLKKACMTRTPKVIIDLAIPRDVEEQARQIEGVTLLNIDDLEADVRRIPLCPQTQTQAQRIIDSHLREYLASFRTRLAAPTIDALYERMRNLAAHELADARAKFSSHDDADLDEAILKRAMHRMIGRMLHPAAANLRRWSQGDGAEIYLEAVRKLFDLGEDNNRPRE